ncbi:MAG TPA: Stp1/IreP family PP2C-type Ser/Thr phosphatase [Myxococcota bacterium]|nr:Stp1/IreP family PP2C-type Ser/Thr phosphatase [Myxococcota bacterium]
MELAKHFRVEALVRLSEGRMFYLVSDDRSDQPTRKCWECGIAETPRSSAVCTGCGHAFDSRTQFLMSVRWDPAGFEAYARFFEKRFKHPGILHPDDVFVHQNVLCSVVRYRGEALLLDEASPLNPEKVLNMGQRFAGLLAYLHHNGVSLARLTHANMLIRREEGRLLLFDPDVAAVYEGPVPDTMRGAELRDLGEMLRRFTPVNVNRLRDFFAMAEEGAFANPLELGRGIEELFDEVGEFQTMPGIAAMTDVGLARILNEDNWGWVQLREGVYLYVVADGMGGHDSGEVASDVATRTICRVARERFAKMESLSPEKMENILDEAFQEANNTVKSTAEARGNDMGTTLVALLVAGKTALMANVGDSRGYLYRSGELHQISKDHSLVAKMVEAGKITAEEARTHPHSNILLRTVGTERNVEIDVFKMDLDQGDRILMNSDGLWGEVEDSAIEELLTQYDDPRICARELVRAAHHGGGKDNVTLMIVGID